MGKLINNKSGFSAIEALLILVIVGILGFTGWFVQQAKNNADKSLTSNSSATPVIKKKATTKVATPTPTTQYLTIKEWGVKLPLSTSITDTYYAVSTGSQDLKGQPNTVWLGLKSLDANGCSATNGNDGKSPIVASIIRVLPTDTDPVSGKLDTQIYSNGTTLGQYYYGYGASAGLQRGSTCSSAANLTAINNAFEAAAHQIVSE